MALLFFNLKWNRRTITEMTRGERKEMKNIQLSNYNERTRNIQMTSHTCRGKKNKMVQCVISLTTIRSQSSVESCAFSIWLSFRLLANAAQVFRTFPWENSWHDSFFFPFFFCFIGFLYLNSDYITLSKTKVQRMKVMITQARLVQVGRFVNCIGSHRVRVLSH